MWLWKRSRFAAWVHALASPRRESPLSTRNLRRGASERASLLLPPHRANGVRIAEVPDALYGSGDGSIGVGPEGIDLAENGALFSHGGTRLCDRAQRDIPLAAKAALVLSHWFEWIARMPGARYIPARLVRLAVDHAAQPTAIGDECGEIGEEVRCGRGGVGHNFYCGMGT